MRDQLENIWNSITNPTEQMKIGLKDESVTDHMSHPEGLLNTESHAGRQ